MRKLTAVGEATGRYPLAVAHDAVFYPADTPDPVAACPGSERFRIGSGLGQVKPVGAVPMAAAAPLLATPGDTGQSTALLERAKGQEG